MKKYFSVLSIVLGLFSCSKKDKYYNISNENINTLWIFYNVGDEITLKNQDNQIIKLKLEKKERDFDDRGGNGFMHRFEVAYLVFKVTSPDIDKMKDSYLLISFHGNMGTRDDLNLVFFKETKNGENINRSLLETYFATFSDDNQFHYYIQISDTDLAAKEAYGIIGINTIDKINFSKKEYFQVQKMEIFENKDDQLVSKNDRAFYFNGKGIIRFQLNANEYWEIL